MKKLFLMTVAAVALSGCSTTRFVTAQTWMGGDTLYVAYTEWNKTLFTSTYEAKLLRCNRAQDNGMTCVDEQQVNALLNEGNSAAR